MMDPWFRRGYPVKHAAKQVFWWLWQGKVLRDADAVLFTCEEERRMARGVFHGYAYGERVVPYGTAEPPPEAAGEEEAFRSSVPGLGDRPYLLFLSRIHPKKGCGLLIEGFAQIAAEAPDLHLVVAGPDQIGWKAELQALAHTHGVADRIHWPGMLSGSAKFGAYRHAQAFILPSHQENFGIVVAEALACGCPVLISNQVNIWREVEAAGAGLVANDTVAGTADLLHRFLALGIDERAAMGRAGIELFQRKFTSQAAGEELERVLLEIAGSPAASGIEDAAIAAQALIPQRPEPAAEGQWPLRLSEGRPAKENRPKESWMPREDSNLD